MTNEEGKWEYYDDPETAPSFDDDGHLVQWKLSEFDDKGSVVECSDLELGTGQYAEVFLGRMNGGELVAVKILCDTDALLPKPKKLSVSSLSLSSSSSCSLSSRSTGRSFKLQKGYRNIIRAEIQAMSHLKHPNIVQFYAAVPKPARKKKGLNLLCIIMEYVQGEELGYVDLFDRFSKEEFVSLMETLIDAMDYMHKQGVTHSDFHAGNVMVNEKGVIKIIDFGYAVDWSEGVPLWYSTWGHVWDEAEKRKRLRKDWERFERLLDKVIPLWFDRPKYQDLYDKVENRILSLHTTHSPWHVPPCE
mmetsp:Transcript_29972/g.46411  ORF Transcript_29972/g.46411 Transcript_29972/m.46411 type:complete len:304 (-) Transcript_29972:951-1862(-)|eukprot:CAMPEP_0201526454 /NCGR_PEP_ID=MMETSP0161_2-20130828/31903_1 /ASSEMBLY_ACC=CAM_ASM_000251 /TAXON_ID=180227 /ORGANISM="Neoparamoeba aestuarina, Strain SoJaBio B1-5/56/2" /LENGTH=303 /DNA_ID=CAMNT_0047926849 /DNA_START=109 /DNA_END=1020 /DNA_ORIENTATION=-